MTPSDPTRPARPRRFSALKPAVKRDRPAEGQMVAEPAPASEPSTASPPPSSADLAQKASGEGRIAKAMARAGLCSRRDAEAWILAGRVAVNGTTIDSPALNVGPADAITVDGYPIDKPERTRLFLFHKARGLVTTARDPEGRPTIFDALPVDLPRLVTIGRLDINTEGLLLLTNDGGLARMLELPSTGWIRRYRVRANGTTDQARLDALAKGVTIDGVAYAGIAAKLDRVQGANLWLTMGLKEGKNREIKRVLEHLGLAVTRLIRISFGPFQLGELGDNAVEEVRTRVLRDQLGSALAAQAGIDFDGPRDEDRVTPPARAAERSGPSSSPKPRDRDAAGGSRSQSRVRAKDGAVPDGVRRQTRRSETADRRGRAVTVEHVATAGGARGDRATKPGPSRSGRSSHGRGQETDTRRFGATADKPKRERAFPSQGRDEARGGEARAPQPGRPARPGGTRSDEPNRVPAADGRPARSRSASPRSRDDDRGATSRTLRQTDAPRRHGDRPAFGDKSGSAGAGRPRFAGKPGGRSGGGPGKGGGSPHGRPGGKGRPSRG